MAVAVAVRDRLRGTVRVKRYWPGKAPDWAEDTGDEHSRDLFRTAAGAAAVDGASPRQDDRGGAGRHATVVDDRRLRRLAKFRADRCCVRPRPEVVSTAEEKVSERRWGADPAAADEEDEAVHLERRRRIRERRMLQEREAD
ncbi:hypothetical protein ACP70R_044388 [Stipagrostis hirtigluma subsp. patula]